MIDQGELFDIPSPCKRICELNNRGYCKGCFRNRDERLYWNQFTTFQKQLVVNLCEKRRLKVRNARNQRSEENDDEIQIPQLELFLAADDNEIPDIVVQADDVTVVAEPEKMEPAESNIPQQSLSPAPQNNNADVTPENPVPISIPDEKPAISPQHSTTKNTGKKPEDQDNQLDMFH